MVWLLGAVFCAAALFLVQYRYDNKYRYPGVQGQHGTIDLSAADPRQQLTILVYGWEAYPQKLLSPGGFEGQEPVYVYLGQYGGFESGNPSSSPHGCATYRLNIKLPPQPKEYALELPEIYTASRVYINGDLVSSLGDITQTERTPAPRTGMVTFHAGDNAELVIQAADSVHYYSGMVYPPAFGTVRAVSDLMNLRFFRTCLMVISAVTIGIMYLLIGLKTGSEKEKMTLFALTCLMFAVHVTYPLLHLFGAGYWSYRLEDVSFYLFLLLLVALHCNLCDIGSKAQKTVLLSGIIVALLALTVPPTAFHHSLDAMMLYSAFLDVYRLVLFGWLITTALLNRQQGSATDGPLLAGLCVIAVSLLFQTALPVFEPVRFGWQTENAGFFFILLLAGGLWFDTVSAYAQRAALTEHVRLMKKQFSLQEENYRIISGNFDEIRKIRHDLRHHLHTIKELARQQQYEELEHYIDGCEDNTAKAAKPVLCDNTAVNAILNYYQRIADQKEIPLELKVSLPAVLKLEGWNLGVIFGNLIENAIEAAEKLPKEKRSVKVYSRISKGNLLLTVKNSWNREFRCAGEQVFSTKHEGPGIGLSSVHSLVDNSGGQFYLSPEKDEFEVSVVLWKQV